MCEVDWDEVKYLVSRREKGLLTKEALVRRVHLALKGENKNLYITLKTVQALDFYKEKVEG